LDDLDLVVCVLVPSTLYYQPVFFSSQNCYR
jgi:hypothetical protein